MARLDLVTYVSVKGANTLLRFNQNLADTEAKITRTQKAIGLGVAALGGALIGGQVLSFLGDAAKLASGLEEAQNKVNVVFGKGSKELEEWAEAGAEAFGTSKRAALEAAGTYGNLFRAFGIAQPKAQEMSTTLVELAADMASFNNTSIDDALEALRSGLSGETEPLKRFGVALTDARLKEIALAEGLYDGVGALDASAKAQAAYILILQDTALAQGDFARTSDGLANSQKRIDAALENTTTEFGKMVASIQLGAIRVAEFVADAWEGAPAEAEKEAKETADAFRDAAEMEIPKAVQDGINAARLEYAKGGPVIAKEAGKIAGMFPDAIAARDKEIRAAGLENVVQFALGLLDSQNEVLVAMETLQRVQDEALDRGAEITRLKGQLASAELAAGLNSNIPAVRLAAQAARAVIIDRLSTLNAWTWGYNLAGSLAAGMEANLVRVRQASVAVASATGAAIRIESEPPDHSSPLYGITKWGGNIVKTLADGMMRELGSVSGASTALAGGLLGGPLAGVSPTGMGGSVYHTHIHLTYAGKQPDSDNDLVALLEELAPFIDGRLRAE